MFKDYCCERKHQVELQETSEQTDLHVACGSRLFASHRSVLVNINSAASSFNGAPPTSGQRRHCTQLQTSDSAPRRRTLPIRPTHVDNGENNSDYPHATSDSDSDSDAESPSAPGASSRSNLLQRIIVQPYSSHAVEDVCDEIQQDEQIILRLRCPRNKQCTRKGGPFEIKLRDVDSETFNNKALMKRIQQRMSAHKTGHSGKRQRTCPATETIQHRDIMVRQGEHHHCHAWRWDSILAAERI